MYGFTPRFDFPLQPLNSAAATPRMVPIPASKFFGVVWSLGNVGPYDLPAFELDRFEVTNRQYQAFIDQGAYRKPEFWKERIFRNNRELPWQNAMELFRDSTGQPGPSTWRKGRYPDGQADYPVSGVSWYEAAAYADFVGKSLPALAQWYLAAPSDIAKFIMAQSNFSAAVAPVGKFTGLGPFGTSDMAGNVAEWCPNEAGDHTRYLLGGAATTSTNEYFEPAAQPPLDRSQTNGIRCVRNTAPLPSEALAERRQTIRDFAKAIPAPDPIYRIYSTMYDYTPTPLRARVDAVSTDPKTGWRK